MPGILIAEPSGAVSGPLRETLSASGYSGSTLVLSLVEAEGVIRSASPDVLMIGPSVPAGEAVAWVADQDPGLMPVVVLIVEKVTTGVLRDAMRAGVGDVLSSGDSNDDIVGAVQRAVAEAERRRPALPEPVAEVAENASRARIVTVFSTKGGVGKTVIATNLASALAKKWGKRVALLDLDLQFGDVGIMLGLEPKHTIHDAVQVFDRLDADMIEGFMIPHESGLRALLAPIRPEDAESITANRISRVLDLLQEVADVVIVDTSPAFSDVVLAAIDRSDDVYVVTMMDVASIKNTRISLQKLRQLGYDSKRLRLVLNRADSKVFLRPDEVEDAIGGRIIAKIPSDLLVPRSVNKGTPVVLDAPRSDVAKGLLGLAQDVLDREGAEVDDVA